jgi:hypothetical protein
MYIRATDGIINLITIENIEDAICEVSELPSDFYQTLHLNKYLANSEGIYLNPVWEDPELTYEYFIIPTDFIGDVTGFSTFVKKAYTDLNFNIICEKQILNINGTDIEVSVNVVNMSIGAVRIFDEAGIGMINGIISAWNQYNPTKLISEPYRFNNFDDMMAFRKNNI